MTEYAVAGWCAALDIEGASQNTIRAYRAGVTDLAAGLPGSLLDATRTDIRQWLSRRKADGLAPATLRLHLKAVKLFFKWLVAEGDIATSPAGGIKEPPADMPVTRTMGAGQMRDLLATCKGNSFTERRDTAILMLFLDTGIRLAESAGLHLHDLDLVAGHVLVHGKGARRRGKKMRLAPFGARTGRALSRYLRARAQIDPDHDALWVNARRPYGPMVARRISAMVAKRGQTAGIERLHPHMFRHTWASEFRRSGGTEGDLMVLGGWSSRSMLDRYGASVAAERAHEAARRLSLGDRRFGTPGRASSAVPAAVRET